MWISGWLGWHACFWEEWLLACSEKEVINRRSLQKKFRTPLTTWQATKTKHDASNESWPQFRLHIFATLFCPLPHISRSQCVFASATCLHLKVLFSKTHERKAMHVHQLDREVGTHLRRCRAPTSQITPSTFKGQCSKKWKCHQASTDVRGQFKLSVCLTSSLTCTEILLKAEGPTV